MDDYELPAKFQAGSRSNNKVTPMRQPAARRNSSVQVWKYALLKPTSVDDAREITETFLSGRTVILNLEGLDLRGCSEDH